MGQSDGVSCNQQQYHFLPRASHEGTNERVCESIITGAREKWYFACVWSLCCFSSLSLLSCSYNLSRYPKFLALGGHSYLVDSYLDSRLLGLPDLLWGFSQGMKRTHMLFRPHKLDQMFYTGLNVRLLEGGSYLLCCYYIVIHYKAGVSKLF